MPTPAGVAAGRSNAPTGDYPTDLAAGWVQTRPPAAGGSPLVPPTFTVTPASWNAAWLAALAANAGSVCFFTSSFGQGAVNCSDVMNKSYIALLQKDILGRPGVTWRGTFYPVSYSLNWLSSLAGSLPWVFDLAPSAWGWDGPGFSGNQTALNNGSNPIQHFVIPHNPVGTAAPYPGSIVVWYFDPTGASGNITTRWDAAGTTPNIPLSGSNTFKSVTLATPDTLTQHTLNIMTQPAANNARIVGISCYPGTNADGGTGIFFNWWAWSACPLQEFGRTDKVPADRMAQWSTKTSPEWTPDLCIFDMPNDLRHYTNQQQGVATPLGSTPAFTSYGYPPGMYYAKLTRLIEAMRASKPPTTAQPLGNNISFLNHLGSLPDTIYSDMTSSFPGIQNAPSYFKDMAAFAAEKNMAHLNTNGAWGEFGFGLNFMTQTDPHPTDNGMIWLFNQMKGVGV